MMLSWTAAAMATWLMCTRPNTSVLVQSKDEERAVKVIKYIKTLWQNSLPQLKARWKPKGDLPPEEQSYRTFELANGSWAKGVPGNPDKTRSEHPTVVILDEAAIMEHGEEILNIVLAARPLHIWAISSAFPSWFQEVTEQALPIHWPNAEKYPGAQLNNNVKCPCPGLVLRQTNNGSKVMWVHYTADPTMTPERVADLRKRYTNQASWDLEMEIKYDAKSGAKVYPEFDEKIHVIPHEDIPKKLCRFMATDPHPRTPHAHLWIGVDRYNDWYVYREYWPSIAYGTSRVVKDNDQEKRYSIKDYVETLAFMEGNRIEWRYEQTVDLMGIYRRNPNGEVILNRYMDQAGKAFRATSEDAEVEVSLADRYNQYGMVYDDPYKMHRAGEDAIHDLLRPRFHQLKGNWPRIHISDRCPELIYELKKYRYRTLRNPNDTRELHQDALEVRSHMIDLLRYLATAVDVVYRQGKESEESNALSQLCA